MAQIELSGVSKHYRDAAALLPTDLDIADGAFLTLLGPSGCGKTTTLRLVAGFVTPDTGTVRFDGRDVTRLSPARRDLGMVFQDYALFPHLTVAQNIGFGLVERGVGRAEIKKRVADLLELIRLPDIGGRLPAQISGGQQQRVALARAIAFPPQVLLMDEPLAALDLKLREDLQIELRRLHRELGITTIFVTHDQSEAMYLSDQIAVMSGGRVVQVGTPQDVYNRPASRFVAEFIGRINLLPARLRGELGIDDAADSTLAVRPQHLHLVNGAGVPPGHNSIAGVVVSRVFSGNLDHIAVQVDDTLLSVETRAGYSPIAEGDTVTLHWSPQETLVLTH